MLLLDCTDLQRQQLSQQHAATAAISTRKDGWRHLCQRCQHVRGKGCAVLGATHAARLAPADGHRDAFWATPDAPGDAIRPQADEP